MKYSSLVLTGLVFVSVCLAPRAHAWKRTTPRVAKDISTAMKERADAARPAKEVDPASVLARDADELVGDHRRYYQGLSALHNHDYASAERSFRDLLDAYPDSVWTEQARLRLAETLIELNRYDEAKLLLTACIRSASNGYEEFEARLLMGRALIGAGDVAAVDHVRRMAVSATEEARLKQIEELFDDLDRRFHSGITTWFTSPAVQLSIAESFHAASQWDEAARRIKRHVLPQHLSAQLRDRAEYVLAQALARTHHYDEAVNIFERLYRSGNNQQMLAFWLARTYAKMNLYDKAIAIRRDLARRSGKSRAAADYLAKIAVLLLDQGDYELALKEWNDVLAMGPTGRDLMDAKWNMAWCNYRLKRYGEAIAIFDWMQAHGAKRYGLADRVIYWKARTLIESGHADEGRALLRSLAGGGDYYAELARRRLANDTRTPSDFAKLKVHGGVARSDPPRIPDPQVLRAQGIHAARAAKLIRLGLRDSAAREVRASEKAREPVDVMVLMELARESDAHDVGRRVALARFSPVLKGLPPRSGEARYVWEQAHPEAYREIVAGDVRGRSIDDDLVWSIMKAESNFRPQVVSPAGAIGLMQLMPSTARKLAGSEHGFDSGNLLIPATNIDFGTRYLGDALWRHFPGDYVAIIAAYNAGEEAVQRWLKNKPLREDIELFIEEIPYDETNLYVKRVLANYWIMKRLYD